MKINSKSECSNTDLHQERLPIPEEGEVPEQEVAVLVQLVLEHVVRRVLHVRPAQLGAEAARRRRQPLGAPRGGARQHGVRRADARLRCGQPYF